MSSVKIPSAPWQTITQTRLLPLILYSKLIFAPVDSVKAKSFKHLVTWSVVKSRPCFLKKSATDAVFSCATGSRTRYKSSRFSASIATNVGIFRGMGGKCHQSPPRESGILEIFSVGLRGTATEFVRYLESADQRNLGYFLIESRFLLGGALDTNSKNHEKFWFDILI